MSRSKQIIEIHSEEGLRAIGKKGIQHLLVGSRLDSCIKSILGEELHQKIYMYSRLRYWPHISNPRSFNEKILHRKLYTNENIYSTIEDKWEVREYVRKKVGSDILPELYHVAEDPNDIPFSSLPDQYVVKPTHLSGPVIIVEESSSVDTNQILKKSEEWLNSEYGRVKGEYWYSRIKPRIIVEEYINADRQVAPIDFKFYVFHGKVEYIHVTLNRYNDDRKTIRTFYDRNWNIVDVKKRYVDKGEAIPKPDQLEEMIDIAEQLGDDFDFIRIDLYSPDDQYIVFGEMTVAEGSGGNPFEPVEFDFMLGSLW